MNRFIYYIVRFTFPLLAAALLMLFFQQAAGFDSIVFFNQIDTPQHLQEDWPLEHDVIIVDTSSLYDVKEDMTSRTGLARILDQLDALDPQVVAIDIFLEKEGSGDEDLLPVIQSMGDRVMLVNRFDVENGGLLDVAVPYREHGDDAYGTVWNHAYMIPSPRFIDASRSDEILPFSIRTFERAMHNIGIDHDRIKQFIDRLSGGGDKSLYLSYYHSKEYPLLESDAEGNLLKMSFIPSRIDMNEFGTFHNDLTRTDVDRQVLRESYILDKSVYYIKSGLSEHTVAHLSRIFIEAGLYSGKTFFLGDWYSPFNDKLVTPKGIRPGVYIHAHAYTCAVDTFQNGGSALYRFSHVLNGLGVFIFLVIFIGCYVLAIDYIYITLALGNFRRSYLVQSIIMLVSILLLVITSVPLYWQFSFRLPLVILTGVILLVYNFFLLFDYQLSLLLARSYASIRFGYLPKFNRRSFIKFYIEADLYNKLNILINTFELMLQYLSFIAVSDIYQTLGGEKEIPKKSTGLIKDLKQKLRRPTTGIFRYILMDLYPGIIKENRFFDIDSEVYEELNNCMNDFINLRNNFFHKSGSFYTDKTKRVKVREYIKKIETFFKLLDGLKVFSMESKNNGRVWLTRNDGARLLLSPLVIVRPSIRGNRQDSLFLYNSNLFSDTIGTIDYVSNVTDDEPEMVVELPQTVDRSLFEFSTLGRIKNDKVRKVVKQAYQMQDGRYRLRPDQSEEAHRQVYQILVDSGYTANTIDQDVKNFMAFFESDQGK